MEHALIVIISQITEILKCSPAMAPQRTWQLQNTPCTHPNNILYIQLLAGRHSAQIVCDKIVTAKWIASNQPVV